MTTYFYCPVCDWEIEVYFELGEHFFDVPDECENCNKKFSEEERGKIAEKLEGEEFGKMVDFATDRLKDKNLGLL